MTADLRQVAAEVDLELPDQPSDTDIVAGLEQRAADLRDQLADIERSEFTVSLMLVRGACLAELARVEGAVAVWREAA